MDFLHDGLPGMKLVARWRAPKKDEAGKVQSANLRADLVAMLGRLNICSKEYVVRQYDHEVQGGSVVKPLCGAKDDGPSDAAVMRPVLDRDEGIVVANGIVPRYSDVDTYAMVSCAVDEGVRNAVCVGADPDEMAGLDNFCWCDPVQSPDTPDGEYKLAQLVRANRALYDTCVAYGIPLISGKDSMKNDYRIGGTKISIPPTLLFSVVAKIPDVGRAVTMDFKQNRDLVYCVGVTRNELGASEYALMKGISSSRVPCVHDTAEALSCYRALYAEIREGHVRAAHDVSDGGLAVALAEMCIAGELGAAVELSALRQQGCSTEAEVLFSESSCRILVEVAPEHARAVEKRFAKLPLSQIGTVVKGDLIEVKGLKSGTALSVSRLNLKSAWKKTLDF
jgi:phosphoribosylformylglycinamidine synthase